MDNNDPIQKLSPMMAQWHECKHSAPDSILLFRLGDFYEAFYEDAVILSKQLDLTLTQRQGIPMAGVPFHASDSYIDKLLSQGYRISIAEQMEDPRNTKGLVKRQIVRTITPGTVIHSSLLSEKRNHFLVAIAQVGKIHGLAALDLTTAEFYAMEFEEPQLLIDELCRLAPQEILLSQKWEQQHGSYLEEVKSLFPVSVHAKEQGYFEHAHAYDTLLRHFAIKTLDGFGLKGMAAAISTAGATLHYVKEELHLGAGHLTELKTEQTAHFMCIDKTTQRHLELIHSNSTHSQETTLLSLVDQTQTAMGGRLLKKWLSHPLLNPCAITERQQAVAESIEKDQTRRAIESHLSQIYDLERLIMRIEMGCASPRDLNSLRLSLEPIPSLLPLFETFHAPLFTQYKTQFFDVSPILDTLRKALVDNPPIRLSDGHVFKAGYNAQLDALRACQSDSQGWIAQYQAQLREQTQIRNLKVGFTKAFGFYIEISRGQLERVPVDFQRRQTLTNAERFITPLLKEYEEKVLHAEERIAALEHTLFIALRQEIASYSTPVRNIARALAHIDTLFALATTAQRYQWTCPVIDTEDLFHIEEGRHPVIESVLPPNRFVPNDVLLNADTQRLYLITGPNMAGKSTFIRQVALIAILAQMGSFIPATRARIGIIDKIFSRIGANDDLARGQSTFMVEMAETANILHNATPRSLVILDEIGRGTSTYDGVSIAWAVAEYLLTQPDKRAKTLFATHYWELTALEQKIPGAVNFNVAVDESEQGIVFLRKIVRGGTDKSYGIHVAKLAGIPLPVIRRAQEMLKTLEKSAGKIAPSIKSPDKQLSFLTPSPHLEHIKNALNQLDPYRLTPMDALQRLIEWKELLSAVRS